MKTKKLNEAKKSGYDAFFKTIVKMLSKQGTPLTLNIQDSRFLVWDENLRAELVSTGMCTGMDMDNNGCVTLLYQEEKEDE